MRFLRSMEFVVLACMVLTVPLVVAANTSRFHAGKSYLLGAALLFDLAALAVGLLEVKDPRSGRGEIGQAQEAGSAHEARPGRRA